MKQQLIAGEAKNRPPIPAFYEEGDVEVSFQRTKQLNAIIAGDP